MLFNSKPLRVCMTLHYKKRDIMIVSSSEIRGMKTVNIKHIHKYLVR